jgi:C4-dicarboxylate transporter DctQ subunit
MTSDTSTPATDGAGGNGIDRGFGLIASVSSAAATTLCAVLIVTTTFSVVVYQRGITISWLDDLLRMLLIWLVFLGSVSGVWRRDHITMDAIYTRFAPGPRRLVDTLVAVMGLITCGFLTWVSLSTTLREREFSTLLSSGELPAWPQTLSIPVSFGLMTVAYFGVLIITLTSRVAPPPPSAPGS